MVWSEVPFQVTRTVNEETGLGAGKFAPFTVSVRAGLPTTAEFGERLVSVAGGTVTVKVA